MKTAKSDEYNSFIQAERMGARPCKNCKPYGPPLAMSVKTIALRTMFVEVICPKCNREALSEVTASIPTGIKQCIARWNSNWPDVSEYHTGESEGIHYGRAAGIEA